MQLINFSEYPIANVLNKLLKDKTTGKNIIFATDSYDGHHANDEITDKMFKYNSILIQPRVQKTLAEQSQRTRSKAEVFTPSWICNKMNNHCDTEWFGRENVFNTEHGQTWTDTSEKVSFPESKTWQQYIDSRRLEITCGEAPYIVSRYDAATGEIIPIKHRIGILDRKLRIVNENTETEEEWLKWTYSAFKSVYGYEYQGDNLTVARCNLVYTFCDYLMDRWNREATKKELDEIAKIVVWNLWQMDGLQSTTVGKTVESTGELTWDMEGNIIEEQIISNGMDCKIYDWKANRSVLFSSLKKER